MNISSMQLSEAKQKVADIESRLVSHHMRLLGVLSSSATEDWLVLVDYDDTK